MDSLTARIIEVVSREDYRLFGTSLLSMCRPWCYHLRCQQPTLMRPTHHLLEQDRMQRRLRSCAQGHAKLSREAWERRRAAAQGIARAAPAAQLAWLAEHQAEGDRAGGPRMADLAGNHPVCRASHVTCNISGAGQTSWRGCGAPPSCGGPGAQ